MGLGADWAMARIVEARLVPVSASGTGKTLISLR